MRERRVIGGCIEAAPTEQRVEGCIQRLSLKARGEALTRELVGAEAAQRRFVFEAGAEFYLAELHGLKTARRVELVAKAQEADRRHRLKNVYLVDEHLLNLNDAAHCARS